MTIHALLRRCWPFFLYAGLFSLAGNILALSPSLYLLSVFDRVLPARSNETLWALSIIFLFALAIEALIDRQRTLLLTRLGETFFTRLQSKVFASSLHFSKVDPNQKHGLMDLEEIKNFFAGSGLRAAFEIPWIPLYLWVLWLFHPLLSLIAFFSALIMLGMTYLEEIITQRNEREADLQHRRSHQFLEESFLNAEAISAMGMQKKVELRWDGIHSQFLAESSTAQRKASILAGISKFVRNTLQLAEMGAAAWLVINVEGVSPGVTVAATIILGKAMSPMLTVLGSWREFIRFRAAFARLSHLLSQETEGSGFQHPPPMGLLSVERLFFFIDRNRVILQGVTFQLNAGESLGIVGASGSGKTSLARLIVGLHASNDGCVRLDGVDVFHWGKTNLGEYIGYLPQSQQLFDGTVAENICRMADPMIESQRILEAAKRAGAHEMILRLSKGYDTPVGPSGSRISGGQRQLIVLARALFGEPRLVVMDEPNANLDALTETSLIGVFNDLRAQGVTQIVVSHEPRMLHGVDKLLVLEGGHQIAFGERQTVIQYLRDQRSEALRRLISPDYAHPTSAPKRQELS